MFIWEYLLEEVLRKDLDDAVTKEALAHTDRLKSVTEDH
jgi:hypothetical protein